MPTLPTYTADIAAVIVAVKKEKAKRILLQLPDGLKPRAQEFATKIEEETGATVLLWAGSSFGACDLPQGVEKLNIDLLFHFGHSPWRI
jgi:2-(3-amino-3-carboxypropyl)histidine synthase